jgi:murein DD-endopeptidase MepM/ murein hydrolase activator NlpD
MRVLWMMVAVVCMGCAAAPTVTVLPTQARLPTSVPTVTPVSFTVTPTAAPSASASPTQTPTATLTATASASATVTTTPSPTATATPLPPLEITYEGIYALPLELRAPVRAALEAEPLGLPDHRLTVSAYRDSDGWAKITLVPTGVVEAGWRAIEHLGSGVVEVLAERISRLEWRAYRIGGMAIQAVAERVPVSFVNLSRAIPPLAGGYHFPWRAGEGWWATQGWHDGNALDFQPGPGASHAVLAAESGWLTELCSDGFQSMLQLAHADGRSTFYLHVTVGRQVRRTLLDQAVQRGQTLGYLMRDENFRTPCGQGGARHLHFAISARATLIEGYNLEDIARTATCCAAPPVYISHNRPPDA